MDGTTVADTALDELSAVNCRESFECFVREFWDNVPGAEKLKYNWHIGVLCKELQEVAERVFKREERKYDLCINVPFGTSKSTVISILFPAWVWCRMPEARFLVATHTDGLVLDLAGKSKDVIESDQYRKYFPEVQIRSDMNAKENFANTHGGERKSCTVGGKTPTGRHAHYLLCDDLIDPQGARSEAELETARRFCTEVLPSRVVDKDIVPTILVMQRLHPRDPTQVMLDVGKKEFATPVRHICLPGEIVEGGAEVNPPEYKQHYVDNLLDITRLSRKVLKNYEAKLGPYAYGGQILQNPRPPGGGMFNSTYFNQRERASPYNAKRVRCWDRACLIAGTKVLTTRGEVPIELVVEGDFVPDRYGKPQKVLKSWMSKLATELTTILVPGGFCLTGTPDHPVWTHDGWCSIGDLHIKKSPVMVISKKEEEGQYNYWTYEVKPYPVYDITVENSHEFWANGLLCENSTQDGGCYTAGVLMALSSDGNLHIEHVVHGQWEPDQRNKIMRATALRDRTRYGPKNDPVIHIEHEGGSSGVDAWKGVARALAGFDVRKYQPKGKKDVRAEPWSSALASGLVYIVDNGESTGSGKADWDINNYIEEHTAFRPTLTSKRLGKYADQVDASSMAYTILVGVNQVLPLMRIIPLRSHDGKRLQTRMVVCSKEELLNLVIEQNALLISITDPEPEGIVGELDVTPSVKMQLGWNGIPAMMLEPVEKHPPLPLHGLEKMLDAVQLEFVDLDPALKQETWEQPIEPWNKPVGELVLTNKQGKKLWNTIVRQRAENPEIIVLVDDGYGDGRALSIAYALCDYMHLPRQVVIHVVSDPEMKHEDAKSPNQFVYDMIRSSRNMVV